MPQGGFRADRGLDARSLRIAVVVARFNAHVTEPLYEGCRDELLAYGLREDRLRTVDVPGCFELPLAAKLLATSGEWDAVVCLGAVIRGDTPHFEYVSAETARGIQQVSLDTGVPVIFGVLTTDNEEQALVRIGGAEGHKGREAAATAIEMAHTVAALRREGAEAMTQPR